MGRPTPDDIVNRMAAGERLIQTYQSGSFLLGEMPRPTHLYYPEVVPLLTAGRIEVSGFEGKAPGGFTTYRLVTPAPKPPKRKARP